MTLDSLMEEVELARKNFIEACSGLTKEESTFRPTPDSWSITDIAEHIVRAEWGGVNGIWQAIDGYKHNTPVWSGENINKGLSIETIVDNTWQRHQPAPEPARPQWGGPVDFWIVCLKNCRHTLTETMTLLTGIDPEEIIYPHPLSGPLNVYQRLAFLRYHMERHQRQIENIKSRYHELHS